MDKKRLKNWWYYYKWYVIIGLLLAVSFLQILGRSLGLFEIRPDLQIAYVGKDFLPADTAKAVEQAFTALAEDYNKDGQITVVLNQYVSAEDSADSDSLYYKYASEVTLLSDIEDRESYFFLTDDPEQLQKGYQILAGPEGDPPGMLDHTVDDKVFLWKDCLPLADQDLGLYTETVLGLEESGLNQERLSSLYLGRRFFYEGRVCRNRSQCDALWDTLKKGAKTRFTL